MKERLASVNMAPAILSVALTIIYGSTLGIKCFNILEKSDNPKASVASINSCSLRDKICPRTIRANPGQLKIPIKNITISILLVEVELNINAAEMEITVG